MGIGEPGVERPHRDLDGEPEEEGGEDEPGYAPGEQPARSINSGIWKVGAEPPPSELK